MRTFIVRTLGVLVASAALVLASVVPAGAASGPAGQVFTLVNQQRAANSLPALVSDPVLDNAAQAWANYLASNDLFEHSSSEWRNAMISGGGWIYSGENIAAGYATPAAVMDGWMGSSGHRANILSTGYVGVGIGYATGGSYGRYWVQIFADSLPRVTPGNAPTISGSTALGSTLTASATGWQSGTQLSWAWASNGAAIPGATAQNYVPTLSDTGRTLTVTVTGSRSGYYSASRTSGATSTVSGAPPSTRLSGADRYATAVAISKAGFAPGVAVAYVASGTNFPDALAATPAAALLGGPLLLTAKESLPATVLAELQRLQPARIVIAGGENAISDHVLDQLETVATTTRISGDTRYDTSRELVADAFTSSSVAYLATGLNFPDALSAGAAAASIDAPVVLVDGGAATINAVTLDLLHTLGVTSVRIAGGTSVVSQGIQNQLTGEGFTVQRLAGADRFETARAINAQAFPSASTIYLASAQNFPDALAGAALAGSVGAPMYITTGACIPATIERGMTALHPTRIVLLGGASSLTADVAAYLRC